MPTKIGSPEKKKSTLKIYLLPQFWDFGDENWQVG